MLQLVDQIAIQVGVKGLKLPRKLKAASIVAVKEAALQSPSQSSLDEVDANEFSDRVDASILGLCPPAIEEDNDASAAIRRVGATGHPGDEPPRPHQMRSLALSSEPLKLPAKAIWTWYAAPAVSSSRVEVQNASPTPIPTNG